MWRKEKLETLAWHPNYSNNFLSFPLLKILFLHVSDYMRRDYFKKSLINYSLGAFETGMFCNGFLQQCGHTGPQVALILNFSLITSSNRIAGGQPT